MGEMEQSSRRKRRATDGVLPPLPECEKAGQVRQRRGFEPLVEEPAPPEPVKSETK